MLVIANLFDGAARAQGTPPRSNAQIEQLVAPIALYPDSLLSQVLMASTYPLEVVEAARWLRDNANVTGKALEDAVQQQSWDPSVKALTSVPQTLEMMNGKIDWTQQLGDAFLAQQKDVLDAVQRLRARADAAGHLKTSEQQKVTRTPRPVQAGQGGSAATPSIAYGIESANPEMIYVPIYDPNAVYGTWPYADNAPFYWTPPGYVATGVFSFAAGVAVGAAVWGRVDWRRNRVDIDVNKYNRFNRTNISNSTWTHDPAHRRGAAYRDSTVAQRFGDQSKAAAREAFRGKADAGRQDLAKQTKQGGKQAQQGGNRQAKAQTAGGSKAGAKSKQASAKSSQAARTKQASQTKQAQRSQPRAGSQQASHQRAASQQRAAARSNPGMQARAQHAGPAGGRAGGGGRGGGGGGRGGGGRR
jgi:hypothetical protein